MEYNIIGNIGYITIKWHPIYKFSLWIGDRCVSEHPSLIEAVDEIVESYNDAINTENFGFYNFY